MNEQDRQDFERLKRQQARLEQELGSLSTEIRRLENRFSQTDASTPSNSGLAEKPPHPQPKETLASEPLRVSPMPVSPPPIPPSPPAEPRVESSFPSLSATNKAMTRATQTAVRPELEPAAPTEAPPIVEKGSFEMRLGTYWLVRVGIVMLLTALVFFGNFAYQKFISDLGPAGKVSLMYLGSLALLAAGAWWQRKAATETLKNYAQVLFAGGLAAVYFTTYAAHHIENLRVIQKPEVDGILLLAWAGFTTWIADRKKSEVLALFAVGLAYYSSVMTRVGTFTLYSNLVLTLAACFFLVRNRWATLTFGSLAATYASYVFWRFFDGTSWDWTMTDEGLWKGLYFLGSYWSVFTAAVFLSRSERFAGQTRAAFLTFNNGAFFTLFVVTMLQVRAEGFWVFSLGYGAVLLVLAETARRMLPTEPLTKDFYLTQGLLLVTVGLIAKFAGLKLALLLGAESVILLLLGVERRSLILQVGAFVAGALSVGWAIDGMQLSDPGGMYLGAGLGAMMLANVLISDRQDVRRAELLRPRPSYFTALTLITWMATTWNYCQRAELAHVLVMEGLLLTLSVHLLRIREISLMGQMFVVLGHIAWLANHLAMGRPAAWQPLLISGITLGLVHWWQRETTIAVPTKVAAAWQWLYSLAIVLVVATWLGPQFEPGPWVALTGALALAFTVYAAITRTWPLGGAGQVFILLTVLSLAGQYLGTAPSWYYGLVPIAALSVLSTGAVKWFDKHLEVAAGVRNPLLSVAQAYRWAALLLTIWWVSRYIPSAERIWVFGLLGAVVFGWAGWQRNGEKLLFSAVLTSTALLLFWRPFLGERTVHWPDLVTILLLLAQRQVARRMPSRYSVTAALHNGVIVVGGLSLWLFLSRWVLGSAGGIYLTASWSVLALALFGTGIALKERMYRWLGLGVLACALARVMIFDVWKLDTLYRILSFLALGIVLLLLGFIYSKYQDKIRQWL